jgi:hypothetical protein
MHRKDRARARRNRGFDQPLVNIQRVRPNIDEHWRCAPQDNRVGGGDESKGGKNYLIPRTEIA